MSDVLLTVSGEIPLDIEAAIAQQLRPQADYLKLAQSFDADLLDYRQARQQMGWFGRLLESVGGPNLLLAWRCFQQRNHYRVIVTDGEQVGIPLAMLSKLAGLKFTGAQPTAHMMIAHILSVGKKRILFDLLGLQRYIDTFVVYATWQKRFIEERWHVPQQQVYFTPFMVDSTFFAPTAVEAAPRQMICAVGLEFRDYHTLLKAVDGLDVEVVIAAASPWSKRSDTTAGQAIPPNVTVRKFSQYELRQLYADSSFVVMPLYAVDFQAGVTAILEAMAMEKAVICSRTAGQNDIIVEGKSGLYVAPGDVLALREAIRTLLAKPEEAAQMGKAGRAQVEAELNLDSYALRLQQKVQQLREAVGK